MQHLQLKFNTYYIAYLALGIIWGTNFLFMKWASAYITPLQIVFLRVLAGSIPVFDFVALIGVIVGLGVLGTGAAYIIYYVT